MKKTIYIDMDDVLCHFSKQYHHVKQNCPKIEYPQSLIGFFESLEPIDGGIETLRYLLESDMYDPYILTAPSVMNPHCYREKRLWVEKHLGTEFVKRLIISPNKGLHQGDILIDDHISGRGQDGFGGKLVHFGGTDFPDWSAVSNYLKAGAQDAVFNPDKVAEVGKIIYVDMDDVLCDYSEKYRQSKKNCPQIAYPQSQKGFFTALAAKEGAIAAMKALLADDRFEPYILTAPSVKNPNCYTEKRLWVERHLGMEYVNRLIISPNKGLNLGPYLIDDNITGKGQEGFQGEILQFGKSPYKNWADICRKLKLPLQKKVPSMKAKGPDLS